MAGVRRGAFTCVGWQVTLCDPIWQAKSRSSEMGFPWRAISAFTFYFTLQRHLWPCQGRESLHGNNSKVPLSQMLFMYHARRTHPDQYIIATAKQGAVTRQRTCLRAAAYVNAECNSTTAWYPMYFTVQLPPGCTHLGGPIVCGPQTSGVTAGCQCSNNSCMNAVIMTVVKYQTTWLCTWPQPIFL